MIRYPHIKYSAYLKYRKTAVEYQKALDNFCLPWPSTRELTYWMSNIPNKKSVKWVKNHGMNALNTKPGEVAFDVWWHDRMRNYLTVAILRGIPDAQIYAIMKSVFRVRSEKFLPIYKNLFFDIDGWDISDLESYLDNLEGEDYKVFKLAISDVNSSLVFKELDVQVEDVQYTGMLKDILLTSYAKWKKSPGDLKTIKAILRVGKELRDVSGTGNDILEELRTELEKPKMEHRQFTIEELIERQQRDIHEPAPTEDP